MKIRLSMLELYGDFVVQLTETDPPGKDILVLGKYDSLLEATLKHGETLNRMVESKKYILINALRYERGFTNFCADLEVKDLDFTNYGR